MSLIKIPGWPSRSKPPVSQGTGPYSLHLNEVVGQVRANFAEGADISHVLAAIFESCTLLVRRLEDLTRYEQALLPSMAHSSSQILSNHVQIVTFFSTDWEALLQEAGVEGPKKALYRWAEQESVHLLGELKITLTRPKQVVNGVQPYLVVRGRITPEADVASSSYPMSPTPLSNYGLFGQDSDPFQDVAPLEQPRRKPAAVWTPMASQDGTLVSLDATQNATAPIGMNGMVVVARTPEGADLRLPLGRVVGRRCGPSSGGDLSDAVGVLPEHWTTASRRHLRMDRSQDGGLTVTDVGSTNGTLIRRLGDAPLVLTPHQAVTIAPGDEIGIDRKIPKWFKLVEATVISTGALDPVVPAKESGELAVGV